MEYYQTLVLGQVCPPPPAPFEDVLCNTESFGDNIIRLVNPNGGANGNVAGAKPQPVCAMVYVFDDDEEMGECCGCSLSAAQLTTFSVNQNLTSNWGIQSPEEGTVAIADNGFGAIAIVATAQNALDTSLSGESGHPQHAPNQQHMPCPKTLMDFSLPNGLSIKVLEPLRNLCTSASFRV